MSVTKTDQHREGNIAFLARSGKVTCPVAFVIYLESWQGTLV